MKNLAKYLSGIIFAGSLAFNSYSQEVQNEKEGYVLIASDTNKDGIFDFCGVQHIKGNFPKTVKEINKGDTYIVNFELCLLNKPKKNHSRYFNCLNKKDEIVIGSKIKILNQEIYEFTDSKGKHFGAKVKILK